MHNLSSTRLKIAKKKKKKKKNFDKKGNNLLVGQNSNRKRGKTTNLQLAFSSREVFGWNILRDLTKSLKSIAPLCFRSNN